MNAKPPQADIILNELWVVFYWDSGNTQHYSSGFQRTVLNVSSAVLVQLFLFLFRPDALWFVTVRWSSAYSTVTQMRQGHDVQATGTSNTNEANRHPFLDNNLLSQCRIDCPRSCFILEYRNEDTPCNRC